MDGKDRDATRRLVEQSVRDFENRPRPQELSPHILSMFSDDDIELAVIDFVTDKVIDDQWDRGHELVTALPTPVVDVYATWHLEAEVLNGGFVQYFVNSSGEFAREAYMGLQRIGAQRHAAVFLKAVRGFGGAWKGLEPDLDAAMQGDADAFQRLYPASKLDRLDSRFQRLGELSPFRIRFIRAHADEFRWPV
jgi:hypothetical protein